MSEWKEVGLGAVVETNQSSINRDYSYSEILYLDTGSITCNRISGLQRFPLSGAPSRAKRLVKDLDIIYSSVRPNQLHYGIIRNPTNNLVVSTGFVVITCNKEEIEPYFLYHYLSQKSTTEFLHSIAEGSTSAYPSLKPNDIESLEILLPPLPEQKAIASVLSSLDDKIDLLHRQNKTLEAMAETLFREWFVESPDKNWKTGILSDLVEVKYGKDHKKLLKGSIPVYGSGGIMRYAEKTLYEEESVLIPRKGTLNNVIYINEPFWTVDTMFYTIMKKENIAKFIYHFVKKHDLAAMNVGSAVPSMTTKVLNNMPIEIPSDVLLENFENTVSPWYKKMKSNVTQINTLEKIRDTLLPKLMSGEIRIATNG